MFGRRVKVYFDGGCRPNPGTMSAAVVVRGVTHHFPDLGQGTSTQAEWLALIEALRLAVSLELENFVLIGDAAGVIHQANGRSPSRSADLRMYMERFAALRGPHIIAIKKVGRSQNLAGIALARIESAKRQREGLATYPDTQTNLDTPRWGHRNRCPFRRSVIR